MQLKVDKNWFRLDNFLKEKLNFSRSFIKKLIEDGIININGKKVKPARKIRKDEIIEIGEIPLRDLRPKQESSILSEKIPLDIIYEDDDLIVINKKAGMITHPAPTSKVYSGTLVNALLSHTNLSSIGAPMRPGIVHRLDKDTSGLIIAAKNDFSHLALMKQLTDRTLTRIYLAVVGGDFQENTGEISASIGRHPKERKKQAVTLRGSRKALTYYKVLERFNGYTLLEIKLQTGRTHQIRVHMNYIKHPVVGDTVYGGKIDNVISGIIKRQALHAYKLEFIHPRIGKQIGFTGKIPEDFEKLIDYLRSYNNTA